MVYFLIKILEERKESPMNESDNDSEILRKEIKFEDNNSNLSKLEDAKGSFVQLILCRPR